MMKYVLAGLLITLARGITEKEFLPEEKMIEQDIEIIEEDMQKVEKDIEKHSGDKKRDNVFDVIERDITGFISHVNSVSDYMLGINCTDTSPGIQECGWIANVQIDMEKVKTDFCTGANNTTNKESLLGSSCKESFNFNSSETTDTCARLPCNLMSYVYEEMPTRLGMLKYVESLQDFEQWLLDTLKPISPELLCDCKNSFYRSVVKCATSYDGFLVHEPSMADFWNFLRTLPEMVSMQPLEDGLTRLLSAYCGDKSATGAYMRALDLHDIAVEVAEMVDNSLEDKKSNANNLRRMSDKIYEMVDALQAITGLDDLVKAITILPNAFWFEHAKKIAKSMQERINGKCAFRGLLGDLLASSENGIHLLLQFASSISRLMGADEVSVDTAMRLSASLDPIASSRYHQLYKCKDGKKETRCVKKTVRKLKKLGYESTEKQCEKELE